MRRRILILTSLLAAGAIVNCAIAWSLAYRYHWPQAWEHETRSKLVDSDCYHGWSATRHESNGASRVHSSWSHPEPRVIYGGSWIEGASWPLPHEVVPTWSEFSSPQCGASGSHRAIVVASGWPLTSMWGGEKQVVTSIGDEAEQELHHAICLGGPPIRWSAQALYPAPPSRILPLAPLWPGFAYNTVMFAATLWLVLCLPLVIRRFVRARRGLCRGCGYPVGTSPVCSECGRPLRRRAIDERG